MEGQQIQQKGAVIKTAHSIATNIFNAGERQVHLFDLYNRRVAGYF